MQESRPILGPAMDIKWSRRRMWLNRCLLGVALLLAVLGIVSLVTQPIGDLTLVFSPTVALIASAVWILIAYLFGRTARTLVSSWLIVLFVVAWFGLGLYLLPGATMALLPAALLPIGLAALLLNRRSILAATALVVGIMLLVTSGILPPAAMAATSMPFAQITLAVAVACVSSVALALVLVPLRSVNVSLTQQIVQQDSLVRQLANERHTLEQERDAALTTVARQQQYLAAFADTIRDGAISVNDSGEIVNANTVAQQLAGDLMQATAARLTLPQVEHALAAPSDAMVRADIVPVALFGLAPEQAFSHVLLDRREQTRLARLRGELLGLLTDEMRNPLTSMVTALDLTLGQSHLPEDVDRVLIGARQSGQRLLDLVTMLLDISQLEQNPDALRRVSTSMARVIEAGIAQLSPLAQRGAITVSVEHAGDSALAIDAERVQRAFGYLLEQSLRQSPPYSVVLVRTRRADGQLVVEVTDQGPGRTTQQSEQLFRAGGDERSASSLGLIYSKLVIEAHGGRVWAESNNGQGSTYTFTIPVEQQQVLKDGS